MLTFLDIKNKNFFLEKVFLSRSKKDEQISLGKSQTIFCNHARWLLNMHDIHYGFLAISDNVRFSCSSLKEPVNVLRKEIANQTEFRQL